MSTSPEPESSLDRSADLGRSFAAAETAGLSGRGLGLLGPDGRLLVEPGRVELLRGALVGRPDGEAVARHRQEYREPSIWIWRRIVGASFAFILITVTWYLLKVPTGLLSDEALPTQTQVSIAFNEAWYDGFAGATLVGHAGASLVRLALGLGIGSMAGVALGLLAGAAPLARTVVDPVTSFVRMVPGIVVAPLLIVWFGAGDVATVFAVAFAVLGTAMTAAAEARITGLRGAVLDLPLLIVSGMRSTLLVAWMTVLALETVLASTGLGALVWFAQGRSDMIVVGIYAAGLAGFVLDTSLRAAYYFLSTAAVRP